MLTDLYFSYDASGLLAKKRMGAINSYLEAQYTYNNEGQVTSLSYPGTYEPGVGFNFGPVYNYYYDTMGRPNRMTLNGDTRDWVKDVVYGPAGEMAQMKYWYEYVTGADHYYSETLGYNNSLQLTSLDARTAPTSYSSALITQNYSYDLNGNVNQVVDSTASSTVNYTYDNLNRLSTAATASTAWGLSFTYDDFGNRTGQSVTKGSAPTSSLSISTTNNRITTSGYSYDNNGNLTAMPGSTMSYDIENRMTQITGSFGTENYKYGPDNNRIRKTRGTSIEHYYFYGAYGELLGVYAPYTSGGITYGNMTVERNVYFAGKLIRSKQTSSSGTVTDAAVVVDRLGSVRNRSNVNVSVNQGSTNYPFGEEILGTDNNREKFATYFRDKDTGLDYARNRYYASTMGRFLTPDPYGGSPNSSRPGSWNRYAYTENSSVTYFDPNGLMIALPGGGGYGGGGGYWFEGGGACFQDIGGDIVYVPCAGPGRAPKDGEDAGGREGGGGNSSTPPNSPNPSSGSTVPPGMSQTFLSGFLKDFYSYVDATANSVTSKDGCLNLFFTSLMNKITGIPAGVGGEASAVFYGGLTFNRALQYALTTPSRTFGTDFLIYPYKSSVFRNMLKGSILVGWLAQLDIAAFQALIDEYEAALSGKCE
ncbi:MAG: RHS repeat-associated core domain-containing protein [Terriglobia bacterium]